MMWFTLVYVRVQSCFEAWGICVWVFELYPSCLWRCLLYWVFSYLLMSVQHFGQCEFFCIVLKQSKISLVALFPSFNISDQCRVKGLYLLHPLLSGHCDLWPLTSLLWLFATSAISGPHEVKVKYFIILFKFSFIYTVPYRTHWATKQT